MAHLRKIDEHLGRKGTRFLTGDTMCCFDCELMPRLQHIRVAGKYFADFEIPEVLVNLWRYMHHMYRLDAFLQSCPADQDIINHYKLQQVQFPFFSFSNIPLGVELKMEGRKIWSCSSTMMHFKKFYLSHRLNAIKNVLANYSNKKPTFRGSINKQNGSTNCADLVSICT